MPTVLSCCVVTLITVFKGTSYWTLAPMCFVVHHLAVVNPKMTLSCFAIHLGKLYATTGKHAFILQQVHDSKRPVQQRHPSAHSIVWSAGSTQPHSRAARKRLPLRASTLRGFSQLLPGPYISYKKEFQRSFSYWVAWYWSHRRTRAEMGAVQGGCLLAGPWIC